jgi:uncharacterized glyoxalase superfamily protein PhnB
MGDLSPLMASRDMKATIEFYRDKLGFQVGMIFPTADNPEYVDLKKDGMVLMFIPAEHLGIGSGEKLGTGIDLYMQIDGDIDEYYEELKGRGVTLVSDIKDEPFGVRDFKVEDIDGYRLTFNQVSGRTCMSCGMPMMKIEDFGGGSPANIYCVHCTHRDGSLKSWEEAVEGLTGFMMETQGLDREAAAAKAREHLGKMPAWSG